MKLMSFGAKGRDSYGVVVDGGVFDLGKRMGKKYPTLRDAIAANRMAEIRRLAKGKKADYKLSAVRFNPVIPNPDKVICIGINYEAHMRETGRDLPKYPMVFVRFSDSQTGHNRPMYVPKVSKNLDYEGELAVVIGKGGRYIDKKDSLKHVAGYTCYNDGSVRDWQRHTIQFTPGKNFPTTGPSGPWMVTADEIKDPSKLTLETRLNGTVMQHSPTSDLFFDVVYLVSYVSNFTNLVPGDLIVTGTPGGVGAARNPPVWMKPGDVCEVEISGIGTLRTPIRAEPARGGGK
jgi:2-keto-4-pentenoate hydratase/2-oxohepta-3-ene-1,7-dioic acid hydratase in catechol pathway